MAGACGRAPAAGSLRGAIWFDHAGRSRRSGGGGCEADDSVRNRDVRNAKARARKTLEAGLLRINPGDFLLSHAVSRAVPSAPAGLTSVFGMGTGVTLPTKSPENFQNRIAPVLQA